MSEDVTKAEPAAAGVSEDRLRKAEAYVEAEDGVVNRLVGWAGTLVTTIAVTMSLFHLYAAIAGAWPFTDFPIITTQPLRYAHVAFVLMLSFLLFPLSARFRDHIRWWDVAAGIPIVKEAGGTVLVRDINRSGSSPGASSSDPSGFARLGGRLDATNVIDARVVLLTNVALEHTDVLGETPVLSVASDLRIADGAAFPDDDALSLAERMQQLVRGPVVAGLHSLAAASLTAGKVEGDALVCSDDDDAKAAALELAATLVTGRALDADPEAVSRAIARLSREGIVAFPSLHVAQILNRSQFDRLALAA